MLIGFETVKIHDLKQDHYYCSSTEWCFIDGIAPDLITYHYWAGGQKKWKEAHVGTSVDITFMDGTIVEYTKSEYEEYSRDFTDENDENEVLWLPPPYYRSCGPFLVWRTVEGQRFTTVVNTLQDGDEGV